MKNTKNLVTTFNTLGFICTPATFVLAILWFFQPDKNYEPITVALGSLSVIFFGIAQVIQKKVESNEKQSKELKEFSTNEILQVNNKPSAKFFEKTNERVMVLIDGENLAAATESLGTTLNFLELRDSLQRVFGTNLSLNYYAHNNTSSNIFSSLSKLQYRVYLESNSKRNLVDSQIGIDVIEKINEFNTFVILSGDGDFINLVENLRLRNKQVIIVGIPKSTSMPLIQKANNFISLKEFLPKIFSD
mgnify:CR=1 FL=1